MGSRKGIGDGLPPDDLKLVGLIATNHVGLLNQSTFSVTLNLRQGITSVHGNAAEFLDEQNVSLRGVTTRYLCTARMNR